MPLTIRSFKSIFRSLNISCHLSCTIHVLLGWILQYFAVNFTKINEVLKWRTFIKNDHFTKAEKKYDSHTVSVRLMGEFNDIRSC